MILLLPFIKVLIVITLLFGLWVMLGGSVLFAFISVLITGYYWYANTISFDLIKPCSNAGLFNKKSSPA